MKKKSNVDSTKCSSNAASCSIGTTCCEDDNTKCKGTSVTCDSGKFKDPSKYGNTAGSGATNQKANCCTAKATCNDYWQYVAAQKAAAAATASGATQVSLAAAAA